MHSMTRLTTLAMLAPRRFSCHLMHFLHVFSVFLFLTVQSVDYNCPSQKIGFCSFEDKGSNVVCKTTHMCHLQDLIHSKENVTTLDLSFNNITNITRGSFSGFTNLSILSLAYNKIRVLNYSVLHGLHHLAFLNLTMNPLTWFSGNLSGLLTSLSTIDATGISHWKPDSELFELRTLTKIIGWTYSKNCRDCLLYRSNTTLIFSSIYESKNGCDLNYRPLNQQSYFVQMLNNTLFRFRCKPNMRKCLQTLYSNTYTVPVQNRCLAKTLVILNSQCILGIFAAVLNVVVFLTILTSKNLRKNISMRLVCNMAFSDFLISVFIVVITSYVDSFDCNYLHIPLALNCWKIGFLWMLGQSGSVLTTFFLTLERYFVIVYSLQPDIRISGRMAVILVIVNWVVATFLTSYAMYYELYRSSTFCMPINLNSYHFHVFGFTMTIGLLALFFYLLSFLCYIHIYIAARRTGRSAGVKRESKLAKRIALLVFTNMFFFFFPVLALFIVTLVLNDSRIEEYKFSYLGYIILNVVPFISLTLNSFCNPILHAFRNGCFNKVLQERACMLHDNLCRPLIKRTRGSEKTSFVVGLSSRGIFGIANEKTSSSSQILQQAPTVHNNDAR